MLLFVIKTWTPRVRVVCYTPSIVLLHGRFTRAHSRKRPALVATTFLNSRDGCSQELRLNSSSILHKDRISGIYRVPYKWRSGLQKFHKGIPIGSQFVLFVCVCVAEMFLGLFIPCFQNWKLDYLCNLVLVKVTPDLHGCPCGKKSYVRHFEGKHSKLYIVG